MDYQDNTDLSARFAGAERSTGTDEPYGTGDSGIGEYYAVAPERVEFVRRVTFRLRDGKQYSVPYAYLPVVELKGNECIRLLTNDVCITVRGKDLQELFRELEGERVIWIAESLSGKDINGKGLFVKGINIEGDLLDKY